MARESIAKVPNQTAAKRPNCFSSFFLSSDGLAQYCVNLSRWFTHETTAFSTEHSATPSLFHNFEASQGARSHSNTTASNLGRHFLYLHLRMRTQRSLSNNTKLLLKSAELESKSVCIPGLMGGRRSRVTASMRCHCVVNRTRHLKRLR